MRTLIVDDEPQARAGLRLLLERDEDVELVGEAANGREAIREIQRLEPDLVLLDIQMPGLDGFDVLAQLDLRNAPLFIFVTAHDEHTLRAFEVHALDYLLKPFTDPRFAQALGRAKERHRERRAADLEASLRHLVASRERPSETEPIKRFPIRRGDETFYVDAREVRWIEAEEYCVRLHVDAGRSYLLRGHLGHFAGRLETRFVRVHRSAMVNLEHVRSLRALFKGRCVAVLDDGTEVQVSRGRRAEFEERLQSWG